MTPLYYNEYRIHDVVYRCYYYSQPFTDALVDQFRDALHIATHAAGSAMYFVGTGIMPSV